MASLRAKIVQISDLHFSARTDPDVERQLASIVKSERPNVLIVAGDIAHQPWPPLMRRARKFLDDLCHDCQPDLRKMLVIPGNHDYKFNGLIGLRRITRIPFHAYFDDHAGTKPAYGTMLLDAINPRGRRFHNRVDSWADPELGICVLLFNSNSLSEMAACGEIGTRNLQEVADTLQRELEAPDLAGLLSVYRIGVVHHHPVPTVFAPESRKDRLFDSFMVFYNAGRFLRRARETGLNLILHGHRHCASFSRIGFAEMRDSISIAAAGTSLGDSDDRMRYHLNIIEVRHDDTATLRSHFFLKDQEKLDDSREYVLSDLDDVRFRRERAMARFWNFRTGKVHKRALITPDGYTQIIVRKEGCRALKKETVKQCRIYLEVARPYYVRHLKLANEPVPPPFTKLVMDPATRRLKVLAQIEFGQPQGDHVDFSYGYQYRLMNGHSLYREEFVRRYGDEEEPIEYVSADTEVAARDLVLEVEFPPQWKPAAPPAVQVVFKKNLQTPDRESAASEVEEHNEEYERVKGGLEQDGNVWRLSCRDPIPGFIYRIRWSLPSSGERSNLGVYEQSSVDEQRRKLLAIAGGAAEGKPKAVEVQAQLRPALQDLARRVTQVLDPLAPVDIEVNLLLFDPEERRLRVVLENRNRMSEVWGSALFAGEGCGGFAFEKKRPVLYHPKRDPDGLYLRSSELREDGIDIAEHAALVCFPWEYQAEVIGVVAIAARTAPNVLEHIFDLDEKGRKAVIDEITALIRDAAAAIVE